MAERATAQRQRRGVGVINVADRALGRGGIDDNPSDFHLFPVLDRDFFVVGMDDGGMAQTAELQHALRIGESLFCAVDDEISGDRGQFFEGERIFQGWFRKLCQEDFGVFWYGDASVASDYVRGMPHDDRVDRHFVIIDNVARNLFDFFGVQEVAAVLRHEGFEFIGDFVVDDHRLFRGADHSVIKRLGHHQVGTGAADVDVFMDTKIYPNLINISIQ